MIKSQLKLLHIISDVVFLDSAYRQFENVAPGANTYLLPDRKNKIKYLKTFVPLRVSRFAFFSKSFIKSLERYDAIIIHGMTDFSLEVIGRSNTTVKFVWIGMGFDYYDILYKDKSDTLEENTSKIFNEIDSYSKKTAIKRIVKATLKNIVYPHAVRKRDLVNRISIFSPVIHLEYEAIKQCISGFSADYIKWNYGAQTDLIDSDEHDFVKEKNILVGNSASPNNNHIEVFHRLKSLRLPSEVKVIVPLSYGNPDYRKRIIQEGYMLMGDNFKPITEFLDFNSYVNLIKSCSIVIMNHKRQQGAGNIGIALFLGAKIFMNSQNLLLKEYLNQGLTIFNIDDLEKEFGNGIIGLSPEIANFNRNYLKKEKSFDSHIKNTQLLIEQIIELKYK